jgi:hypothetical protein
MPPDQIQQIVKATIDQVLAPKDVPSTEVAALKKELAQLKAKLALVPQDLLEAWEDGEAWRRSYAMYFLTGDQKYVKAARPELAEQLQKTFKFHKLEKKKGDKK